MAIVTVTSCPQCEGEGVSGGVECPNCGGSGEVEMESTTDHHEPDSEPEASMTEALAAGAESGATNALTLPQDDPVSAALSEVTKQTRSILALAEHGRALHSRYERVAFDVRTTKGMEEAKKARLALREEVRYPMQKLKDERFKILGKMQRQANDSADALIEEVKRYETPIHEQIEAEETRKKNERAEKAAAEQRRIEGHTEAIRAISAMVAAAAGMDSADIERQIAAAQQIIVDEGYEEFQGQAQQTKDETLRQLQGLLVAAKAEEAELEETRRQQAALAAAQQQLEADRRAQAERERQLAEREKDLAEKEARQKAEAESLERARQERAAGVQLRIEALRDAPMLYGRADEPDTIQAGIEALRAQPLTADLFDDRIGEATMHRDNSLEVLTLVLAEAQAREADEARAAQAARVQELIDNIRSMGESATLAVQDGSADEEGLRDGLAKLEAISCGHTFFGDRASEALQVRDAAIANIKQAIAETVERDRLRAEEEERRRQEEAEAAAARTLADAKRSHGEELYEMVRKLVLIVEETPGGHDMRGFTIEARELLQRINPAEDFED